MLVFLNNQRCRIQWVRFFHSWLPSNWQHGKLGRTNETMFHFALPIQGELVYWVEGAEVVVGQGNYILIPPGIHYQAKKRVEDVQAFTMRFQYEGEDYVQWNFNKNYELDVCANLQEVVSVIQRMEIYLQNEQVLHLLLEELLLHVEKVPPNEKESSQTDVLKVIRDSYGVGCNVKDLAKMSGYSYRQFIRNFKQDVGVSPMEYILDVKLRRACELLDQGMRVNEVSQVLEYSDTYFFSKQFKSKKGLSPKRWVVDRRL